MQNDKKALLLVNLGSPNSPDVMSVRSYLNQFLMDPYVIDLPWLARRLLVSFILRKRPEASAHAYQSIWTEAGSPLLVLSKKLCASIANHWQWGPVVLAMRYGEPSILQRLAELKEQGITQVTVAPLYPQFADSTVTTVLDEVKSAIKLLDMKIKCRVLPVFFDHPLYIQSLVASANAILQQGKFDHLLLSFHGVPERHIFKYVDKSSQHLQAKHSDEVSTDILALCYRSQCLRTAELFAAQAHLAQDQWSVSFQSRLGRTKWITPYTDERLVELAAQGVKRLAVMCPAFVADCLETLEEIGLRGREQFLSLGGEAFELIPCLNDHPVWVAALNELCQDDLTYLFET